MSTENLLLTRLSLFFSSSLHNFVKIYTLLNVLAIVSISSVRN